MDTIAHFLKQIAIKTGLFLRSNWAYLIWFALHYLIATAILYGGLLDWAQSFLYAAIAYAASIGVALSPIGEAILRLLQGAHRLEAEQDRNYLQPLFEEVYEQALQETPSLHKSIQLYISEDKTINACAIGRKTIIVNRGAIEALHREELKGIFAHELGHMANGDTKATLLTVIGDGFFSIIILAFKLVMWVMNLFMAAVSDEFWPAQIFGFIVRLLFDYTVLAFLFVGNVILSLNSRYSEYLADGYAFQLGYGEQLKRALYLLNKLNMGGRRKLREVLLSSHPHTTARIHKLEQKLEREACPS